MSGVNVQVQAPVSEGPKLVEVRFKPDPTEGQQDDVQSEMKFKCGCAFSLAMLGQGSYEILDMVQDSSCSDQSEAHGLAMCKIQVQVWKALRPAVV